MLVYLDGSFIPHAEARVSVDDRGFLFGDGVYEVTRARGGRLLDHERHWTRLARGLDALALGPAGLDAARLRAISERLLQENGLDAATVYVQVTRGSAPRTHHYPAGVAPTVYVAAAPFTAPDAIRAGGVDVASSADLRWLRCDLKTVNLLPNVMAKQEAMARGAYEALLVRDGLVTEGASTSFFAVIDGVLRTHPLGTAILPGVTRAIVLELAARAGIRAREEAFTLDAFAAADEAFLTSTTNDVMPVVRVDGRSIGTGRPGPLTRQLAEAFASRDANG